MRMPINKYRGIIKIENQYFTTTTNNNRFRQEWSIDPQMQKHGGKTFTELESIVPPSSDQSQR